MNSLKSESIKYLSEKYLGRVNDDISEKLVLINETGVLLRNEIVDLSAFDNDDFEFTFRSTLNQQKYRTSPKKFFHFARTSSLRASMIAIMFRKMRGGMPELLWHR